MTHTKVLLGVLCVYMCYSPFIRADQLDHSTDALTHKEQFLQEENHDALDAADEAYNDKVYELCLSILSQFVTTLLNHNNKPAQAQALTTMFQNIFELIKLDTAEKKRAIITMTSVLNKLIAEQREKSHGQNSVAEISIAA